MLVKPRFALTLPHGTTYALGGWDPEGVLDIGTLEWKNIKGEIKLVPITRTDPESGKPFYDGRPAFLNGQGQEVPRDPATGQYLADPAVLMLKLKDRVDFGPLNLQPPAGMSGS